jgi:hypothetical protein
VHRDAARDQFVAGGRERLAVVRTIGAEFDLARGTARHRQRRGAQGRREVGSAFGVGQQHFPGQAERGSGARAHHHERIARAAGVARGLEPGRGSGDRFSRPHDHAMHRGAAAACGPRPGERHRRREQTRRPAWP